MRISRVLVKLLNRLWLTFATIIITLAIVVSLVRALLPFVNEIKPNIEGFLSDKLATKVTIEKLSGEWFRHGPRVTITGLYIWQDEQPQVAVSEAAVAINIWQSLLQLTIATEEFFVRESEVTLDLAKFKQQSDNTSSYTSYDFLIDVLLGQSDVLISDFTLITQREGFPDANFSLQSLSIKNYADIHQLDGSISQNEGGQLTFIAELVGDPRRPNSSADLYLKASNVELSRIPMMDKMVAGVVEHGSLNGEIWAEWEYDEWRSMYMDFALDSVDFTIARQRFQYQSISSQISWMANAPQERTFLLNELIAKNGDGTEIDLAGLRLSVSGQPSSTIRIDYQDIEPGLLNDVWALLIDNQDIQTWFLKADPQLFVKNFSLTLEKNNQAWDINNGLIDVASMRLNRTDLTPGLPPLHGAITIEQDNVFFDFSAEEGELDYGSVFRTPILVGRFDVAGRFNSEGPNSQLSFNKLDLNLDNIPIKANANIFFHEAAEPELSVQAELGSANLEKVSGFLPAKQMDEALTQYLEESVQGGEITNAQLNIQGRLVESFMNQKDLTFEIIADAKNLDYQYQPNYPKLDELDATLYFNQDAMFIAADNASYKNMKVLKATAEINQFSAAVPHLKLDIAVSSDFASAKQFIINSQLKQPLEPVVNSLAIGDQFSTQLKMRVPLAGEQPIELNGQLDLDNNQVDLLDLDLQLDKVKTTVLFTDEVIQSDLITADLFGGEVRGKLTTEKSESGTRLKINATSRTNIHSALTWLFPNNNLAVYGDSDFTVDGWLCIADCLTWQTELLINSKLAGVSIDYMEPIQKSADEESLLSVQVQQGKEQGKLNFQLQENLYGSLTFDTKNKQFGIKQGSIRIGAEDQVAQVSSDALKIDGQLPVTPLPELIEQLTTLIDTFQSESSSQQQAAPMNLNFSFEGIELAGIVLNNVTILMNEVPGKKLSETPFLLSSEQANGRFFVLDDASIRIELDSFELSEEVLDALSDTPSEEASDDQNTPQQSEQAELEQQALAETIARLPDISLVCKVCKFGKYNLGEVNIDSSANQASWNLAGRIKRDNLLVSDFNVTWDMATNKSLLRQNFSSNKFGRLLRDFGLNVGIRDSAADGEFELTWVGAPFLFNVASLSGKTKLYLNKGYLEEVSDARARIFSLFSLQSVTRRLTLDFEDIYKDGFFYDSLRGQFKLTNGVVETESLVVDGAAADVSLTGMVNLVNQTVDQTAVVSPKVTSSLPVLAGWAVEPTTGVIVWLLSKLFEPAIDVITKIEYRVVGKWDKPQVIELSKSTKEVELTEEQLEAIREVQKGDQ